MRERSSRRRPGQRAGLGESRSGEAVKGALERQEEPLLFDGNEAYRQRPTDNESAWGAGQ